MSECKLCSCRRGESTLASRTYRVRTRRMIPINWCMGHWLTSRFKKNDWHYSIRHLFLVEIHQGGPKYHISTFNIEYAFSINYHFPIHSAYIIIPFLCHLWYRSSNPLAYCVPIAISNCGNTLLLNNTTTDELFGAVGLVCRINFLRGSPVRVQLRLSPSWGSPTTHSFLKAFLS